MEDNERKESIERVSLLGGWVEFSLIPKWTNNITCFIGGKEKVYWKNIYILNIVTVELTRILNCSGNKLEVINSFSLNLHFMR